jgi:large subunit ribosomal protein L22
VANAAQNPNIDEKILYVKEIFVDQGPTLKRFRARAQGRAAGIKKKSSHITVVLDEM